jgi:alpha-L-fucosidase
MLNIGPKSNGNVPYEISQRMLEMGEWLDVNGASIYGAEAFDLPKDQHDWGKITYSPDAEGKHKLYLHVYNWPFNNQLPLTGITTKPTKAYVLRDKSQSPLDFQHNDIFTNITVPAEQPDPLISIVVLEYDDKPEIVEDLVAKTVDGGFSLKHGNIVTENGDVAIRGYDQRGTVPPHIIVEERYQSVWKIFVDEPGQYSFDVSYSYRGAKPAGKILVKAADTVLEHEVKPTGLTVGEPNRDWHIDNFKSHSIGKINFPATGIYEISMEVYDKKKEAIKFQWLWVAHK